MSKPARISFALLALTLVLVAWMNLGALLLTVLFSVFVLQKLHFTKRKWIAVVLFLVLILGLGYGAGRFANAAVRALPQIAERSIPSVIAWAQQWNIELPFTDFESLKATALETVKEQEHYLRNFANFARHASTTLVFVIFGIVVAIGLFLNSELDLDRASHRVKNNLYSLCCQEVATRFGEFYHSFATVMGAQIIISAINTVLTAIFVLVIGLRYAPVLIGATFLCGLLPVLGNVASNTIVVAVSFMVSPKTALIALAFLVGVHKLEYFLNSKIIGDRIRNPIWLTLLGLIIGEKLMGIPGMILAPVVLNYIRVETSQIEVEHQQARPEESLTELEAPEADSSSKKPARPAHKEVQAL
jgi:predicted PurR-regulated permease PerM